MSLERSVPGVRMRFPETSKRRSRPAAIAISSPRCRLSPSPPLPGLDASWLAAVRGCAYRSRATRLVSLERRHNRNGPARVRPNRWAGRGGNRLLEHSAIRVFTADHPPSHASLSANQPGTAPFDQGVAWWAGSCRRSGPCTACKAAMGPRSTTGWRANWPI